MAVKEITMNNITVSMERLQADDLTAIHKLTLSEFAEDDLFTFTAKLIDDSPTANGRIWSKEWQSANVENFVGIPVVVNHENDQALVLGRIFAAEQKDSAIFGKVFVPLSTDVGRQAKEKIESGLFKSVSINASASNTKTEGDFTRILPGDDDRVFEVSFVAVPGCKSCEVVSECECAPPPQSKGESRKTDNKKDKWIEYAEQMHSAQSDEFVRSAGFAISEGFNRETYQNVASRLDPETLRTMTDDYRRICADRKQRAECDSNVANQVREKIQQIKTAKGI